MPKIIKKCQKFANFNNFFDRKYVIIKQKFTIIANSHWLEHDWSPSQSNSSGSEMSIMNQVLNVPRNFISQKMDLKNKYKLAIMTTKKLDSWDLSVMIHSQKDE